MFDNLTGVAYGLVLFAIMVGVGLIILQNFAQVGCDVSFPTYNTTNGRCMNGTSSPSAENYSEPKSVTGVYTLQTYLGSGSGGLVTWVPAVIALIIGVMFISMLMGKQKKY